MDPSQRAGGTSPPTPYGSAQDLPSFRELQEQLRGLKLLTGFAVRDQHQKLKQLERDAARLVRVVDDFYALLGPRNWIFHDSLSVEKIDALLQLQDATDADEAERRFIELYRDPDTSNPSGSLRSSQHGRTEGRRNGGWRRDLEDVSNGPLDHERGSGPAR